MNLNDYRKCFNLHYDQFIAQHDIQKSQIHESARYQKITDAIRVDLSDEWFFFKDGRLKLIYLSDDALVKKLWREFQSITNINEPEETVRSRAGKTSNQVIFAAQGLTASITNDDVDFIELYAPCTLHDYLETIYQKPGPFIR